MKPVHLQTVSTTTARMPRALYFLAFAVFAVATDSFLIAGLIPGIASDLGIGVAVAGHLLTFFALAYALSAPVMATLTGRFDRRTLLMISLGAFVIATVGAAFAPDYTALLVIRTVTALFTCLCTPTAGALAASLVPPAQRGRALALVMTGLTIGPAIGVPLGAAIGDAFGWRAAFLADAALGAVAFAAVALGLPKGHKLPPIALRQRLAPLGQPAVVYALLVTLFWVGGAYTLYTFLAPYFAALGITGQAFALVLALFGGGAFIGNLVGGWMSDRLGAARILAIGIGGLALSLLGLGAAPSLPFAAAAALVLVAAWAVIGFLALPARQSQLVALAPAAAPLLLALNASAMYLGIAVGAALGSATLHWAGTAELGFAGAAVELVALAFIFLERRATAARRSGLVAAAAE
jgi:predicted MFS family arabinose efflux permease